MDEISQLKDPIPIATLLFVHFTINQKNFDRLPDNCIISIDIAIKKSPLIIKTRNMD